MTNNESSPYLSEIIKNTVQIFLKLINDYKRLISAEMQLAGKSLINIFILALLMLVILITTWMCVLGIAIFYLRLWDWGWIASLLWVMGLNLMVLCILVWWIFKLKANLSFKATRRQLQKLK